MDLVLKFQEDKGVIPAGDMENSLNRPDGGPALGGKKECLWNKAKQSCWLSIKPWWPELQPNDYEIDQKKSKNAPL